jgi:monofunctional biosynthetic peptidoglycan transglycosylase
MAQAKAATGRRTTRRRSRFRPFAWLLRWLLRGLAVVAVLILLAVLLFAVVNPPTTLYMAAEGRRLGGVAHEWVSLEDIAPVMQRSVVAAEDANFCLHSGFDMAAIRQVIEEGGARGASTISQQVAKNVYLWQGRSWMRKALEAAITPVMEVVWSKRRILEVYLNVAEFGEGVFGIAAASQAAFGVAPSDLTPQQAARLAVVLPDPKDRSAVKPTSFLRQRAAAVLDGAATIEVDGRAACFSG